MTQRSILLPEPRSLKMPAAMASLTSCLASSSWQKHQGPCQTLPPIQTTSHDGHWIRPRSYNSSLLHLTGVHQMPQRPPLRHASCWPLSCCQRDYSVHFSIAEENKTGTLGAWLVSKLHVEAASSPPSVPMSSTCLLLISVRDSIGQHGPEKAAPLPRPAQEHPRQRDSLQKC